MAETEAGGARPAVICVAAGRTQLPVIECARALGFAVVGIDRDPAAPGLEACDERLLLSTHDAGPIVPALHSLAERYHFRGVLNRSSGPPVVTSAEICAALGLPGVPPEYARCIVDKARFMRACASLDLPAPRCQSAVTIEAIDPAALRFPCVVKPSLSLVGKSGVFVVKRERDLPEAFAAAKRASLSGMVNVEQFVAGSDVTLISVVCAGVLHPIALVDELNEANGAGSVRPRGVATPSALSGGREEAAVLELARRVIGNFHIDTSPFMMACRCEPGGQPRLTEIHLDLGGDRIFDELLPAAAPFDSLRYAVAVLTGLAPERPTGALRPSTVRFAH